ncbi:MAG: ribosome maturation factor RimP [Coriobacteriia bacterium]|nr:ribosome maturation factor RimP [Coriobacteriia bacterium]
MLSQRENKILKALEPLALQHGVEVITVEVVGAKKAPTVRVYIDTAEGVSFDQLAAAQVWVNQVMDELDPFPGAYNLEVSSPGIDRPLRTLEHFRRFVGEQAVVKTTGPLDGRSSFTGELESASEDGVSMQVDGQQVVIPLDAIKKAHVVGQVSFK